MTHGSLNEPLGFDLTLPGLALETGGQVAPLLLRGTVWGPASDAERLGTRRLGAGLPLGMERGPVHRRPPPPEPAIALDGAVPTVLLLHALTGDACPGGKGGWWEPLIGPGRALDPAQVRVLCFNNLGSCYGTSGPGVEGFPASAVVTTWDQARAILAGLDDLGVGEVQLAAGGSLGGMIALCLGALDPARFVRLAPIAASEQASAWLIGLNHVQRQAIALDRGGRRGLEVARQIAMLSYRAEAGLQDRQGRSQQEAGAAAAGFDARLPYRIETYLEHQGQKLANRFEVDAYLQQLGAMDHHDLSRWPAERGAGEGIDRLRASCLVAAIDSDVLYWPVQSQRLAARLRARGRYVEEVTIASRHGHDGFLIEWEQLDPLLRRALALPQGR